jgi:putative hydrolase of the HAD superfamily
MPQVMCSPDGNPGQASQSARPSPDSAEREAGASPQHPGDLGCGFAGMRVISFDLDDTLWAIDPVIQRANRVLFAWLAARYPLITQGHTPQSLHEVCLGFMRARPQQKHDLTRLRKDFLRHLGQAVGYTDDFADEAFEVFFVERNTVELFPEVEAVLARLAQRYTLVALSNGNACIERIGLTRYFSASVNSAKVGAAKPDPAMFHAALAELGESAEAMLHVGDHPEHDILGAQRAGVRAVWLNRHAAEWPSHLAQPDAQLVDLQALVALLGLDEA